MANFAALSIVDQLVGHPEFETKPEDALVQAFHNTQVEAARQTEQFVMDCTLSGTTATMVHLRKNRVTYAHVGDSKLVLAQHVPGEEKLEAQVLTDDHTPNRPAEMQRITRSGGQVSRNLAAVGAQQMRFSLAVCVSELSQTRFSSPASLELLAHAQWEQLFNNYNIPRIAVRSHSRALPTR